MEQAIVIILVALAVGFIVVKKLPRLKVLRGNTRSPCGSCEGCPYGGSCSGATPEDSLHGRPTGSKM